MVRVSECSCYRGFGLSGVFLYENSAQGSRGMQNQLDVVKVRVIGGSSYRESTVLAVRPIFCTPIAIHNIRATFRLICE